MNHDGDTLEGDFDRTTLACFAASLLDGQTGDVSLQLHRFSAGLESRVARVVARARFGDRRSRSYAFVVKEAAHARCQVEASVYAHLAGITSIGFPRLLGFQNDDERTYLFLEYVRPAQSWPWRHVEYTSLVLECLARLHSLAVEAPLREIVAWEYEAELRQSGLNTLDSVERAAIQDNMRWLRPARRIVRKVVASLALMRAELLQATPFGTTLLHGDVHTGKSDFVREAASSRRCCSIGAVRALARRSRTWRPGSCRSDAGSPRRGGVTTRCCGATSSHAAWRPSLARSCAARTGSLRRRTSWAARSTTRSESRPVGQAHLYETEASPPESRRHTYAHSAAPSRCGHVARAERRADRSRPARCTRTMNTGHGARRRTASATLPIRTRAMPERPCVV